MHCRKSIEGFQSHHLKEYYAMRLKLIAIFGFFLTAIVFGYAVADTNKMEQTGDMEMTAKVGEMAPDFKLASAAGKDVSLSSFKGKYVVLEWINFECPFVRKHYDTGNMQKLQKMYAGKDVVWLTICSSAPGKQGYYNGDELMTRLKKEGLNPTAYLIDKDGTVGKMYNAKTTPDMYVINPQGVLIYSGAIDDKPTVKNEDVKAASNYVIMALDASMNGKDVATKSTASYGCSVKY